MVVTSCPAPTLPYQAKAAGACHICGGLYWIGLDLDKIWCVPADLHCSEPPGCTWRTFYLRWVCATWPALRLSGSKLDPTASSASSAAVPVGLGSRFAPGVGSDRVFGSILASGSLQWRFSSGGGLTLITTSIGWSQGPGLELVRTLQAWQPTCS